MSTTWTTPRRRRPDDTLQSARRTSRTAPVVLTLLTGAGVLFTAQPAGAVANGVPAPEGAYEFTAALAFTGVPAPDGSTYDSACSGVLVAPDRVLTAGHCFHDAARTPTSGPPPYASSTVTLGATSTTDPAAQVRTVVDVQQAPDGADAALVTLSEPVADVRPLVVARHAPEVGEVLTLAGWGATNSTDPVPSTQLLTGSVEVETVTDTVVGVSGHAPSADTSACAYDSGAPYVRESGWGSELVSVESGGPDCPHGEVETTTRVDVLLPWLCTELAGHHRRG